MSRNNSYDVVIIGGGFFGCRIATHLKKIFPKIIILEKEADFLQRASYYNQARVHNGYHYPRSLLTALRSRINFPVFVKEYPGCIESSFKQYYAVGKNFSKVSASQYFTFCQRIGAKIKPAPSSIKLLFNLDLVDDVFSTEEYAFDAVKLKEALKKQLDDYGIDYQLKTSVEKVSLLKSGDIRVECQLGKRKKEIIGKHVFNCTYSQINKINTNSHLPVIPLKHELTEMVLIEVPKILKNIGITMMCGPFFSLMPFPPRQLHCLSHVRYTPHLSWHDDRRKYQDSERIFKTTKKATAFPYMLRDVCRYLPIMEKSRYIDSLWEVKTVLPQSEFDDSRPILFINNHDLPNYTCIMGGKIDNIYDALIELDGKYQT